MLTRREKSKMENPDVILLEELEAVQHNMQHQVCLSPKSYRALFEGSEKHIPYLMLVRRQVPGPGPSIRRILMQAVMQHDLELREYPTGLVHRSVLETLHMTSGQEVKMTLPPALPIPLITQVEYMQGPLVDRDLVEELVNSTGIVNIGKILYLANGGRTTILRFNPKVPKGYGHVNVSTSFAGMPA